MTDPVTAPERDLTTAVDAYPRRFCPICTNVVPREFKPGPGGRPNASCPHCGSLERHRFFALLVSMLGPVLDDLGTVLEVAPSPQTTPILAGLGAQRHVRLDLGADNRLVDVLGSLTELPLPDDSIDLLVCYHVLEHVPDDAAAMREIARVLSPGGIGLLQVPYRAGSMTDEDPSASVEERLRRFGQADHVRYYGDDLEDRLVAAGLSIQRVTPRSIVGPEMSTWLHVVPDELVWIVRPAAAAEVPPRGGVQQPTAVTETYAALLSEMTRLRDRLEKKRLQVERLKAARQRPLGIKASARSGAAALRRRIGR